MSFYHHPEERNKHRMMFHTSGFAIAAGVVAVGAAAGSAAISMSAADRAKKAQGAAAGQFKKQQRKAVKGFEKGQQQVQGMISEVKAPEYNLGAMIGDAGQISNYNRQQLEQFLPGAAAGREKQMQLINQAMDVLGRGLQGEYGEELKQNVMRDVAQFAGAGFNPATAGRAGGFQAAQGLAAGQLGRTGRDVQLQSLAGMQGVSNIFGTWTGLADAFNAKVADVGRLQLGYQTAQAEVGLQKAKMTGDMFSNIYNAQSGLASQIYGANKENIASSLSNSLNTATQVGNIGKAAAGALGGVSSAYGQLAAAQGGGYGGYASMGQAQQAAPYAGGFSQVYGSGLVPRATAV